MSTKGIVYKCVGGFYYVKTEQGLVECKPRGIFRNRGEKLVAGDRVILETEADTPFIAELAPRTNLFVRPPVANVDNLLIVASTTQPAPSTLVLDKLTVLASEMEVQPVLVVTKTDLASPNMLEEAYVRSGIPLVAVNAETGVGVEALHAYLAGKLSVFCGNTGVGKSTLLNALLPQLSQQTGEISKKLGRGRHTTREVELFEVLPGQPERGLVADTPGFASLDMQQVANIPKENLQFNFPEIEKLITSCKFTGCAHLSEKGCAVRMAVEKGEITPSRYNSYVALYEEAKANEPY